MEEGTKTKWEGLWRQREGVYSGKTVKKGDIPAYAKLIVRHNKYYEKDSKRPQYVYCFATGTAANAITLENETSDYITLSEAENVMDKVEELAEVMRAGRRNGDIIALPSESRATAADLYEKAIALVEDITGEKWDFSYMSW